MTPPKQRFYKGYYLVTSRCNLDCDYCVLEDAPHQLRRELDMDGKKALISHLYHELGFRRLTLSGGEVLLIGKKCPDAFIELLQFLRTFRSTDPLANLQIEVYSNGAYLDERVADEMMGVVDLVAVTLDSGDANRLRQIGRSTARHGDYFRNAVEACGRLSRRGIGLKLHTVVGKLNHDTIVGEVPVILDAVTKAGGVIRKWKFYQYMSYDDPARDGRHSMTPAAYAHAVDGVTKALSGSGISLHFKDNVEMSGSLFNILPYGNAQYLRHGDTWSTSQRTRDLRAYPSMDHLFAEHDIDRAAFSRFHALEVRP